MGYLQSVFSQPASKASGLTPVKPQHRFWPFLAGRQAQRHKPLMSYAAAGRLQSREPGPVLTPHSGYHFDGTGRRFFEGWYWRVTLPGDAKSFALIYSIENPLGNLPYSGVGAQVMGPDDSYLVQYSPDVNTFWAERNSLALGAVFDTTNNGRRPDSLKRLLPQEEFNANIQHGFQASATWHQGSLVDREAGATGTLHSTVGSCKWAFSVQPLVGWGDQGDRQRATAGWLAALPVFEPHWQVMMAHGLATGWIEWGGERYEFQGAPAYAEKNWGGGFPSKWCWIQCNSFEGEPGASVTAIGAIRGLLQVPGVQENVGLIGIHHRGKLYELNPRDSELSWEVDPWGRWRIWGRNRRYEAVVEATCESSGTPLRAPTATTGLAPFCRDSFAGQVRMRVWERNSQGQLTNPPIVDCTSQGSSGAVETTLQCGVRASVPIWFRFMLLLEVQSEHPLLEVRTRALRSLQFKLQHGLLPPGALARDKELLAALLGWFQYEADEPSMAVALEVLAALARSPEIASQLLSLGADITVLGLALPDYLAGLADQLLADLYSSRRAQSHGSGAGIMASGPASYTVPPSANLHGGSGSATPIALLPPQLETRARASPSGEEQQLLGSQNAWCTPAASSLSPTPQPGQAPWRSGALALNQLAPYIQSVQLSGEDRQQVEDLVQQLQHAESEPAIHTALLQLRAGVLADMPVEGILTGTNVVAALLHLTTRGPASTVPKAALTCLHELVAKVAVVIGGTAPASTSLTLPIGSTLHQIMLAACAVLGDAQLHSMLFPLLADLAPLTTVASVLHPDCEEAAALCSSWRQCLAAIADALRLAMVAACTQAGIVPPEDWENGCLRVVVDARVQLLADAALAILKTVPAALLALAVPDALKPLLAALYSNPLTATLLTQVQEVLGSHMGMLSPTAKQRIHAAGSLSSRKAVQLWQAQQLLLTASDLSSDLAAGLQEHGDSIQPWQQAFVQSCLATSGCVNATDVLLLAGELAGGSGLEWLQAANGALADDSIIDYQLTEAFLSDEGSLYSTKAAAGKLLADVAELLHHEASVIGSSCTTTSRSSNGDASSHGDGKSAGSGSGTHLDGRATLEKCVPAHRAILASLHFLIRHVLMPKDWWHPEHYRGKAVIASLLRYLVHITQSLPASLWAPAWAELGGTYWLSRAAKDQQASIRQAAFQLLAPVAAPVPTHAMLVSGWPECGSLACKAACKADECPDVKAAALAVVVTALSHPMLVSMSDGHASSKQTCTLTAGYIVQQSQLWDAVLSTVQGLLATLSLSTAIAAAALPARAPPVALRVQAACWQVVSATANAAALILTRMEAEYNLPDYKEDPQEEQLMPGCNQEPVGAALCVLLIERFLSQQQQPHQAVAGSTPACEITTAALQGLLAYSRSAKSTAIELGLHSSLLETLNGLATGLLASAGKGVIRNSKLQSLKQQRAANAAGAASSLPRKVQSQQGVAGGTRSRSSSTVLRRQKTSVTAAAAAQDLIQAVGAQGNASTGGVSPAQSDTVAGADKEPPNAPAEQDSRPGSLQLIMLYLELLKHLAFQSQVASDALSVSGLPSLAAGTLWSLGMRHTSVMLELLQLVANATISSRAMRLRWVVAEEKTEWGLQDRILQAVLRPSTSMSLAVHRQACATLCCFLASAEGCAAALRADLPQQALRSLQDYLAAKDSARLDGLLQVLTALASQPDGQKALLRTTAPSGSMLEQLLSLLQHPAAVVCTQAALVLRNAALSPEAKAHFLGAGALQAVVDAMGAVQQPACAGYAAATLWALVSQGEKVKVALRRCKGLADAVRAVSSECHAALENKEPTVAQFSCEHLVEACEALAALLT
ncbi:hypothetical protein N2152v2_007556 [Parachlorella kessleri]